MFSKSQHLLSNCWFRSLYFLEYLQNTHKAYFQAFILLSWIYLKQYKASLKRSNLTVEPQLPTWISSFQQWLPKTLLVPPLAARGILSILVCLSTTRGVFPPKCTTGKHSQAAYSKRTAKSPIIDRFLHFKGQFCSILCKHIISLLHFPIPCLCFA